MRITKFGHSCLLVEENNERILVDPGVWSVLPDSLSAVQAILLTHEHPDHIDPNLLHAVLAKSPEATIYTNKAVGKKLDAEKINYTTIHPEQSFFVGEVTIAVIGEKHAVIYPELPEISNTGYLINNRLFVTGDALTVPGRPVEILALPVCAPWSKIIEVIDYAKKVLPKMAFPVHDGMLKITTGFHKWPETFLPPAGIKWQVINDGQTIDV